LIGSPAPDVLKITYCAEVGAGTPASHVISARALRGFNRNATGSPVATARSPT